MLQIDASPTAREAGFVAMGLGFAAMAMALFLAGVAGLFSGPAFLVIAGAAMIMGLRCRPGQRQVQPGHDGAALSRSSWLLVPLLLPAFLLAAYPPVEWDSMHYHGPLVQHFLTNSQITPALNLRYPVLPHAVHALAGPPVALAGPTAAQALNLIFLAGTCLALYATGCRFSGVTAGVIAAALFASIPVVPWMGGTSGVDAGLTFFTTACLFTCLRWRENQEPGWLIASGLLGGMAAGCKYSGMALAGLALLIPLWTRTARFRSAATYLAGFFLSAAPWYGYIVRHTGNPVWPLAQPLFGYWHWTASDDRLQVVDLAGHGVKHTLVNFIQVPWMAAWHSDRFDVELPGFSVALLAIYALFPALIFFRRKPLLRDAAILALAGIGAWFISAQVLRYLIPVVPVALLVVACLISDVLKRLVPRAMQWPGTAVLLAALVLAPSAMAGWRFVIERGLPPVSQTAARSFVERTWPDTAAAYYLNDRYGTHYTLYAVYGLNFNGLVKGRILGELSGPWTYQRIFARLGTDEEPLVDELASMGADHLYLPLVEEIMERTQAWPTWTRLIPEYANGHGSLFRIAAHAERRIATPELLRAPQRDIAADLAAELDRGETFVGRAAIQAGTLYSLELSVVPGGEPATVAIHMDWMNDEEGLLRRDAYAPLMPAGSSRLSLFATSPERAGRVEVRIGAPNPQPVALRHVSLTELRYAPTSGFRPLELLHVVADGGPAAVDVDDLARDLARVRAQEQHDHVRDLVLVVVHVPFDRAHARPARSHLIEAWNRRRSLRGEGTGRHRIHADAVLAVAPRQGADQGLQRRLVDAHPVVIDERPL
jgi:4-amino-4-deoxy-L-arabinose transferase-like glycosyltransferase